jgi:hypothetical protein
VESRQLAQLEPQVFLRSTDRPRLCLALGVRLVDAAALHQLEAKLGWGDKKGEISQQLQQRVAVEDDGARGLGVSQT